MLKGHKVYPIKLFKGSEADVDERCLVSILKVYANPEVKEQTGLPCVYIRILCDLCLAI